MISITSKINAHRNFIDGENVNWTWSNWDIDFTWDNVFRAFNRVTQADCETLDRLGYDLPSLSVGDIVTLNGETKQVTGNGFEPLDPPEPCGYCRRCAIHNDPGGCLVVWDWEQDALGIRKEQ